MYEYISGTLAELNPAEAIIEAGGIGYQVLISLNTYGQIESRLGGSVKLYLYHLLREDDEALYGSCIHRRQTTCHGSAFVLHAGRAPGYGR